MNRNIPYLKAFYKYCQKIGQVLIINLVSQPQVTNTLGRAATPVTALQMATFSKLSRVIVTVLELGANPSMQNNALYPFDIALQTLLTNKTQWELINPAVILNYLLTQQCPNLHPKDMQDIMSHFEPERLNALLSGHKFYLLTEMLKNHNQRLLSAYQQLARANKRIINVYHTDLLQRKFNFLHAICTDDNEHMVAHCLQTANIYSDLLAQQDQNGQTPFELALTHGKSAQIIQEFSKIIKQLLITEKFKDFDYRKILDNKLLDKNPNFRKGERAELYEYITKTFALRQDAKPRNPL
jgi:hypothetical protein